MPGFEADRHNFQKEAKKCEKRVDMRKRFWYNSVLSGGCVMLRNLNANVAQSVSMTAGTLSPVVCHANPPTDGAFPSEQILSIVDKEG